MLKEGKQFLFTLSHRGTQLSMLPFIFFSFITIKGGECISTWVLNIHIQYSSWSLNYIAWNMFLNQTRFILNRSLIYILVYMKQYLAIYQQDFILSRCISVLFYCLKHLICLHGKLQRKMSKQENRGLYPQIFPLLHQHLFLKNLEE